MANTEHNNFAKLPTGAVDWLAAVNDFMDKVEAGPTLKLTAGENLAKYDPFYVKAADGKAWKADDTVEPDGVWQSTTTAAAAQGYGQVGGYMIYGSWSWTIGGKIYASSGKALTQTPGSPSMPLGKALSATLIVIRPYCA